MQHRRLRTREEDAGAAAEEVEEGVGVEITRVMHRRHIPRGKHSHLVFPTFLFIVWPIFYRLLVGGGLLLSFLTSIERRQKH